MKSYTEARKKYTDKEIAESLVFPTKQTKKQQQVLLNEFRKIRQYISERETSESKLRSQLLQQKFLIEDSR